MKVMSFIRRIVWFLLEFDAALISLVDATL